MCCRLGLPAEIKAQTSKNYTPCKYRCKLCQIKQTGQTTTWKETCIEFMKYAKCRLWVNIYKIYWYFRSTRIMSLLEKTRGGNHLSGHHWYFQRAMSWPVSNKYIYEIYKGREMHRDYVQADSLLFICYYWRSKSIMKIQRY